MTQQTPGATAPDAQGATPQPGAGPAPAQRAGGEVPANRERDFYLQAGFALNETYTDNPLFGQQAEAPSELVSEFVPSLVLRSNGRRLKADADIQLDAIDYLHHTLPDAVLPRGGAEGTLEAVEQHLYVNAAVLANQTLNEVAGASPVQPSNFNTFTYVNYRLSPYWRGELPGGVIYLVRSDNGWLRATGATGASTVDSQLADETAELDRLPSPLGWTVRLQTVRTSYVDPTVPDTRETSGRVFLKAEADQQWIFGVIGGAEAENYLVQESGHPIYGASLEWRPAQRTQVSIEDERRFFGAHWQYTVRHHSGSFVLSMAGYRDVETASQSVFATSTVGQMQTMLDSMLSESVPDPIERAAAIQNLFAQQNVSEELSAAATIFGSFPLMQTTNQAALTWIGRRNSVTYNAFASRIQPLPESMTTFTIPGGELLRNEQIGQDLSFNHRLTPWTSVTLNGQYRTTFGIAEATGSQTHQATGQLRLDHEFTPRTHAYLGARMQFIESNVVTNSREKALLCGFNHRF